MIFISGSSAATVASIRTWSLPLPVQPCAIVSQPRLARLLDRELRDQRPAERGEQRIAAAVERVRLDRRQHVVARELLLARRPPGVERAEPQRLVAHDVEVLARLARGRPSARRSRPRSASWIHFSITEVSRPPE